MTAKPMLVSAGALASLALQGASLSNEAMEIRFADASRSFAVESIVNRLDGERRFVRGTADGKGPHLFELVFARVDATGGVERAYLRDRNESRERDLSVSGETAVISLKGYDLPGEPGAVDVEARVTLAAGSPFAEWRIRVANRSATWGLDRTRYPCLRGIVRPGEADVLLPHAGHGARLLRRFDGNARNRVCAWGEYEYPSYYPMMTAYMLDGAGLAVYADDPDARVKTLWANGLDCWFETPVENAGLVGRAADGPGYVVRTEAFRGSWWNAAKAYRRWALRQKWCAKGPIAKRADYPKAMSEPSLWLCSYWFGAESFTNKFNRIRAECPDLKVGVRWYDWSLPGFGVYPEMLPAKKGVAEAGAVVSRLGYTVMPYVNARIWDSVLASFRYAKKDMCRKPDGSPFVEQWGLKGVSGIHRRRDYGIMCPAATDWQGVIRDVVAGTVEATSAGGVYYDQLGCAPPRGCRNPAHGHPLGGGRWWADGNREIMRQAHAALNPRGIAVTTEGTAECYMDSCDGFLAVTVPTVADVPFYAAVYSGYTIYFGTRTAPRMDPAKAFPLMARDFIWGFANGWSDDWSGPDALNANRAAAVRFALARQRFSDFLVFGTLLGELKVEDPLPEVAFGAWEELHNRRNPVEGTMPAVIGAWWRDCDATRLMLLAVNVSGEPRTVRFRVPGQEGLAELRLAPRSIGSYERKLHE